MIRRGIAAGRPRAHCRRKGGFYLGLQPVSAWSLASGFEGGVIASSPSSEVCARVQRKVGVQASGRRAARVSPTSHTTGAGLVGLTAASASLVDVPARIVGEVPRAVIITWRGRRGPSRRRGIRAAAWVGHEIVRGGALCHASPELLDACLCPYGPVHGVGVRRVRRVAVLWQVCALVPVLLHAAWCARASADVTFVNGAALQVARLSVTTGANGVAAAPARPRLGGSEPASTSDTGDIKAIPLVDECLSRLGAGEDDAHVGVPNVGGIPSVPHSCHRQACITEQGSISVIAVLVDHRSVDVDADLRKVASWVGSGVRYHRAPPLGSPGRVAWVKGRGRVSILGKGVIVASRGLPVSCSGRVGLI